VEFSQDFLRVYELICKGGPVAIGAFIAIVWAWKVMPPMVERMVAQKHSAEVVGEGFGDMKTSLRVIAKNSDNSTEILREIQQGVTEAKLGIRDLQGRK